MDERLEANDPLFSSRMLRERAKKQFVHYGIITSPSGSVSYVPFELSPEFIKVLKTTPEHSNNFFNAVIAQFKGHFLGDKYR